MSRMMNEVAINNVSNKEVGNMIRKAASVTSLDELSLSARTVGYLTSHFDSLDDIIREGRYDAFLQETGGITVEKSPKWRVELVSALKTLGLIRPAADFAMTLRIMTLYRAVFTEWEDCFVTDVDQLSNEQYETFQSLAEDDIEDLKNALEILLTEREYRTIRACFWLDDGIKRSVEPVGRRLGFTEAWVRTYKSKALRKLRSSKAKLPRLFCASSSMEETA